MKQALLIVVLLLIAPLAQAEFVFQDDLTVTGNMIVQERLTVESGFAGTPNQGDIFYDNGTETTRLTPGVSGQVLQTQGTGANPIGATDVSGDVLQIATYVSVDNISGSTALPYDNTLIQKTEGTEVMALSITPTANDNILIIEVIGNLNSADEDNCGMSLFSDDSTDAIATVYDHCTSTDPTQFTMRHKRVTGTTEAIKFKVRIGASNGGNYFFNGNAAGRIGGGVMSSTITITEYQS